jgi:hypothetical protein
MAWKLGNWSGSGAGSKEAPMKPNSNLAPIPVDRIATSEEIRAAISLSSDQAEEYAAESAWEIAADQGGYVRIPSLEIETFRLIEELLGENDSWPN